MDLNIEILQNAVNSIKDAVFVLDRNGDILYFNDAIVQLMGYTIQETLAMNTYELVDTGRMNVHILAQVVAKKCPITASQKYIRKDGSETPYMLVTQTPVLDEFGEVKYSVGSIHNMEQLNHLYQNAVRMAPRAYPLEHVRERPDFVYVSRAMKQLIASVDTVVDSDAAILIGGESGCGKEVLAQYIHKSSRRGEKELITVNCAALPENLMEAELFGYEKGSFTGAQTQGKQGLIELADGGTLFLDEINSLPLTLQGKLLRVLETKEVRRLGGVKNKAVNFRLLTATNMDLYRLIGEQKFRLDLYYRINVLPFTIPPLRTRTEDIQPLCEHFLQYYYEKYGREKSFSEAVYAKLRAYDWPGNIRELKNFVERIVLVTDVVTHEINDISIQLLENGSDLSHFAPLPTVKVAGEAADEYPRSPFDPRLSLKENMEAYEFWMIEQAVEQHGSLAKAATALGSSKSTLGRKLLAYQNGKKRP